MNGTSPVIYYTRRIVANSQDFAINNNANNANNLFITDAGNTTIRGTLTVSGTENSSIAGNVGIGTTNPSEKLSVNGNIRSKKLIVTQSNWADYVFNDGYRLRPLVEIEKFIKTNKHLPDIPTVKEVEQKGIDVGSTQALLLKKIEELTLYLIEQNKKMERMNTENKEMKKQIQQLKPKIK
jgi:hypothetical protein